MLVVVVMVAVLVVLALAGLVFDKLRGGRSGLRDGGNDTMARYYRDVGDSTSRGHGGGPV